MDIFVAVKVTHVKLCVGAWTGASGRFFFLPLRESVLGAVHDLSSVTLGFSD